MVVEQTLLSAPVGGLFNAPVGGYKEWEEHKVKNRSNTLKLFLRLSI